MTNAIAAPVPSLRCARSRRSLRRGDELSPCEVTSWVIAVVARAECATSSEECRLLDEIKTELLEREETIRSKSPESVAQEMWGILLAYPLIRLGRASALAFAEVSRSVDLDVACVAISLRTSSIALAAKRVDRQGAGLGLAIAKAIVAAHRGSLSVESRLGEGSCFQLRRRARNRRADEAGGAAVERSAQRRRHQEARAARAMTQSPARHDGAPHRRGIHQRARSRRAQMKRGSI
jgi:hypothetical protein